MFPQDTHIVISAVFAAYQDATHRITHPEAIDLPNKDRDLAGLEHGENILLYRSAYQSAVACNNCCYQFSTALVCTLEKHTKRVHRISSIKLVEF